MQAIKVILDVDENPPLKGIDPKRIVMIENGITVSRIVGGTALGNSSVAITAPLNDGKYLFLQMTMQNFTLVAAALKGAEERMKETDGRN